MFVQSLSNKTDAKTLNPCFEMFIKQPVLEIVLDFTLLKYPIFPDLCLILPKAIRFCEQ